MARDEEVDDTRPKRAQRIARGRWRQSHECDALLHADTQLCDQLDNVLRWPCYAELRDSLQLGGGGGIREGGLGQMPRQHSRSKLVVMCTHRRGYLSFAHLHDGDDSICVGAHNQALKNEEVVRHPCRRRKRIRLRWRTRGHVRVHAPGQRGPLTAATSGQARDRGLSRGEMGRMDVRRRPARLEEHRWGRRDGDGL